MESGEKSIIPRTDDVRILVCGAQLSERPSNCAYYQHIIECESSHMLKEKENAKILKDEYVEKGRDVVTTYCNCKFKNNCKKEARIKQLHCLEGGKVNENDYLWNEPRNDVISQ